MSHESNAPLLRWEVGKLSPEEQALTPSGVVSEERVLPLRTEIETGDDGPADLQLLTEAEGSGHPLSAAHHFRAHPIQRQVEDGSKTLPPKALGDLQIRT